MNIYIAKDEAFNFIYRETVDWLRTQGTVRFFSPMRDEAIPMEADLIYLPGGYPEFFLEPLSHSHSTMHSLRRTHARIIAECGGMMYLSQGIDQYDMTGLLPFRTTMQSARLHLGYRRVMLNGQEFHGHEFHYSSIQGTPPPGTIQLLDAQGHPVSTGLYLQGNILASYLHWAPGQLPIHLLGE